MSSQFTTALFALVFIFSSIHQSRAQSKEVGARFGGFNDIAFVYKKQKEDNRYRRLSFWSGQMDIALQPDDERQTRLNGGLRFGLEKRHTLNPRLQFLHGMELGFRAAYAKTTGGSISSLFRVQLGYILGLQYKISDHFFVGLETIPSFSYQTQGARNPFSDRSRAQHIALGFDSNAVALTGIYRWSSKTKE